MFDPTVLFSRALQILLSLYGEVSAPVVSLGPNAIVTGINNLESPTQSFLGIPFAEAPRFAKPIPISEYSGSIDASEYGPACIQQNVMATATPAMQVIVKTLNISLSVPDHQEEDCLSINIIRPASVTKHSQLPVVVFFYGGGFLIGDSPTYDDMGRTVVEKSIEKNEEVIFVSFNYRLSAYGFLAGNAMKESGAGSVALHDQREALRWIQKYIRGFGGDPNRVIMWGQSAGAMSASLQMLAYDGDTSGLFHGIFAQSGAPVPVAGIENGQLQFEALADAVDCGDKGNDQEKLECLRVVPLEILQAAVDATDSFFSMRSLVLTWLPRADGEFLTDKPYNLIEQRKFARVPIVTGNVDDEGTLFTLCTTGNLLNRTHTLNWIRKYWAPLNDEEVEELDTYYPNDGGVFGSPFGTSPTNTWFGNPQYKRIAAFQGDAVLQAPRRFLAHNIYNETNVWVYLSKQWKTVPIMGSSHGSDIFNRENHYLMNEHIVKFANNLDPNLEDAVVPWPIYELPDPKLYLFPKRGDETEFPPPEVADDDHREGGFEFLIRLGKRYPL